MNKKILSVALAAAFSAGTANAMVIIDDFSIATNPVIVSAPGTQTSTLGSSSDFSAERVLTIGTPVGPDTANVAVFNGELGISTGIATSVDTTSAYSNAAGFDFNGTEDASSMFFDMFVLSLTSIDQGGAEVTLTVDSVSSTQFVNSIGDISFAHTLFGDLTSVNSVELLIHNNAAVDATFDTLASYGSLQTPPVGVPEPASLALFGLGLAAFGFGRRKAK